MSEMASNYYYDDEPDWVDEEELEQQQEVPCPAHCRGGIVEVHGQETDCITCEGYGTVLT